MKHLSSKVLVVALLALGAAACFSDPNEPLRNGPSRIELNRSVVYVAVGDSAAVSAVVKDEQGNTFAASPATWESAAPTFVVATKDTLFIPGDAFSRAFVRGVAAGSAYVRVSIRGLTDSVHVYVP